MILYILLCLYAVYIYIFSSRFYTSKENSFNCTKIYKRCKSILKYKICNKSSIVFNKYNYGYEYFTRLLNSTDCELCKTFLNTFHVVKCRNRNIKTHRSYISKKYWCNSDNNKLYGTDIIQKWIYNKQHPRNCKNVKYLIIPNWNHGLGSQIHVVGSYLSLALDSNRIATFDHTTISKYFLPLSNCSIDENDKNNSKSYNPYSNDKYVYPRRKYKHKIPKFVLEFLNNSPIFHFYYLHYWRSQASQYIYHLKQNTTNIVKQYIKKYIKCNNNITKIKSIKSCINVWIRHGDKFKEMKLIETRKYFTAIYLFKRLAKINFSIYLSTDDREAINEFRDLNYNVYYLDYPRYNDNISSWMNNHIYNVISDIELSLKCFAFVGTRASNINRLIDELRSTSETNTNIPYFEIGRIIKTSVSNNYLEIPEYW